MKNLKTNLFFKAAIIFGLILILLIPTNMIRKLIDERQNTQQNAINEVSSKWGYQQIITGPYISIPYDKYVKRSLNNDSVRIVKLKEWIYILPNNLIINGSISPEKLYRNIYEVVVYNSTFEIKGQFESIDLNIFDIPEKDIHLDKAVLNIGISDLRGIQKQISVEWNSSKILFESGISEKDIVESGVNAPIFIKNIDSLCVFSVKIDLKGSQSLYFTPVGKTTDVTLKSAWQTPSFTGNYLPDERKVSGQGFTANWHILHLNRNYPQSWLNNQYKVSDSAFGTDLLLPVNNYKRADRVAKYSILFLVFTFMVFFFVEVLNKNFIHPIQYLLVGIALIVFYTLLLSFSEHINFNFSYILAAILTLVAITGYTCAILKSKAVTLLIPGILTALYTFIFIIIQLEGYSLLVGSIGIFIILSIIMYLSRKIDWYSVGFELKQ